MHTTAITGAAAILAAAASASAGLIDHTFFLSLSHSSGAQIAIPPAMRTLQVTPSGSIAGIQNPVYQDGHVHIDNPLHDPAAPIGDPASIQHIEFMLTEVTAVEHADGIIHRDIAVRNLLVVANDGEYTTGRDGVGYVFDFDGEPIIYGVGPVRWMAPEALHTRRSGPEVPGVNPPTWTIEAGSFFDVTYIPAPAAAAPFALGALAGVRRRRAA